ncbi:MAG: adenosylcobinamide-phosphate synthase CbiB [Duncaniella sp.]|nr:adenosylcobinamide-phosphate synthase CbiB [Muribaculum sp.]MCM1256072.1 adenosylcobinamide-phosphate synthase CbiB [Duncaniella sp.]
MDYVIAVFPLAIGWCLDLIFGDPTKLPHPVVGFGKLISFFEHRLNNGPHRKRNGALTAIGLILATFMASTILLHFLTPLIWVKVAVESLLIYYCLAGTTLIKEVKMVFLAVDCSIEEGRKQVGRIVGRDTANLNPQQIRIAALETLAENLSDGVIAPLFWYMLLGVPGMLAYKMVNTLDSMIGYKNKRYRDFGCFAAKIDDAANFIPARLTSWLMVIASGKLNLFSFVKKYGRSHASPNSGYPEAALAGILNCRFGGSHDYFGETVYKPHIGSNERAVNTEDMFTSVRINRLSEFMMIALVIVVRILIR